jgi:CheY-like chemotaxis protein
VVAEIIQKFVQLSAPGARVEWCWNGYEALVRIREFKPDLIFLDYMMPKIDGLSFLRDLRQLDTENPRQVAIVSAFVDADKEQEFRDAGADYVLTKPVNADQVRQIVDKTAKGLRRQAKKPSA